jgi:pentatricopeptide repeat protein
MLQQVTNLGALGQWQEAFQLIEREPIESSDLAAKARGAIRGFALGKQWQLALDVLGKWHQNKKSVPWPVCTHLVELLGQRGQWKMLLTLISRLQSHGDFVGAHTYSIAIQACSESDQCEQAVVLLQQMHKACKQTLGATLVPSRLAAVAASGSKHCSC